MNADPDTVLHLCTRADWDAAQSLGEYRADSLATEGFIHGSTPAQVVATANRHYAGRRDLIVLTIDADKLTAPLRYEAAVPARPDAPLFPHLYGPLDLDAVTDVGEFPAREDGIFG